jgi:hypothetical protein
VAITRRPKSPAAAAVVDVEALINKGGSAASPDAGEKDDAVAVVLRLPAGVLTRVDAAVKARPIRTPRHTWLLEAVHEKLRREEAETRR